MLKDLVVRATQARDPGFAWNTLHPKDFDRKPHAGAPKRRAGILWNTLDFALRKKLQQFRVQGSL